MSVYYVRLFPPLIFLQKAIQFKDNFSKSVTFSLASSVEVFEKATKKNLINCCLIQELSSYKYLLIGKGGLGN